MKLYRKHFQFNVRVTLLIQPKHVLIITNMVSQTSLSIIFGFEFKGGGNIEGGRGGSKFFKLSFMVKHNCELVYDSGLSVRES